MLLLEDKRFYVYVYLDPRKPGEYVYDEYKFYYEPIYVGKGCDKRDISHLSICKKEKTIFYYTLRKIIINNFKPEFFRVKENLIEKEAFKLEIDLIAKIGMKKNKNGPLLNYHPGGCGESPSEETKRKISQKNKGKKKSEETKKKISKSHFGIKNTEETKKKISAKKKVKKYLKRQKRKLLFLILVKNIQKNISKKCQNYLLVENFLKKLRKKLVKRVN